MDFRNNMLHLGNSKIKIPSSDVSVLSDDAHSISVHALEDMDIPGPRCVWSSQLCRTQQKIRTRPMQDRFMKFPSYYDGSKEVARCAVKLII